MLLTVILSIIVLAYVAWDRHYAMRPVLLAFGTVTSWCVSFATLWVGFYLTGFIWMIIAIILTVAAVNYKKTGVE